MQLATWFERLRWKLIVMTSERRVIHGIPVLVTNNRAHASNDQLFSAIAAAMRLIADYRPRTMDRMRRDLSLIWVDRFAVCRAIYYPNSRTCRIDSSFVATFPTMAVASSLVHEGVHARIRSCVRNWPHDARAKEERICRKAEVRFGRAIPGGGAVAERAQAAAVGSRAQVAPPIDWAHANQRAARIRLRETRLPFWVKQIFARLRGMGTLRQPD